MRQYQVTYRNSEGNIDWWLMSADDLADARSKAYLWAEQTTYPVAIINVYPA